MKINNIVLRFVTKAEQYLCVEFSIIILGILSLFSCSLDIPVEDEITGLDAIDSVAIAQETLSGVYVSYPKNKLVFSKLADDFYPNHIIDDSPSDYRLYKWEANEIQLLSNSLWSSYYETISKANMLLDRVAQIKVKTNEEHLKLQEIKAQALSLKALCFFDLIQIYAKPYSQETKDDLGIVLKDKIEFEKLPRSSVEESYLAIEKLLNKAIAVFPEKGVTSYRFSKISAKALLAKLYFNWKKYEKAIKLSTEVIHYVKSCSEFGCFKQVNDESFSKMWGKLQVDKRDFLIPETILVMEENASYFSEIYDSQQNKDRYYLNPDLVFEDLDCRKSTAIITKLFINIDNTKKEVNYLGKLRKEITDDKPKSVPIFRIAELYFVKSECLYHLSREHEAKIIVNDFLQLRNSSLLTSSGVDFLKDLLREKQKEFIGEGIRYFDMKRNKMILQRVSSRTNKQIFNISDSDYRWVFPIGEKELNYNENMKNNSGW